MAKLPGGNKISQIPGKMQMENGNRNSSELPRLNRAMAQRGICSRRKADELIFAGKVKVGGQIETNPARRVAPNQDIEVDGKIFKGILEHVYLMFNKPIHCVCTTSDPQGRQTVMDYMSPELKKLRIFPVGRLDYFSEGLLLLTNDGMFAQKMAHPSHHQTKVYEVTIRGAVNPEQLAEMRAGMILDGSVKTLPVKCHAKKLANGDSLLTMELSQGINRQIRKMCAQLGLTILRLVRVSQGGLPLGNLKTGQFRLLAPEELQKLLTP